MRHIFLSPTLFCVFLLVFFSACTKVDDGPNEGADDNAYAVSEMDFFLSEDDTIDSVFSRLDTITVINTSADTFPDTTIYPYHALEDSVYISLDQNLPDTLLLTDTVSFQHMVVKLQADGGLFLGKLPQLVSIGGFPATIGMPVTHVNTALTFQPTPKTQYEITGEYWRVRYSISFRAYALRPRDGQTIVLQGKVHYSTVSVAGDDGEDGPTSVITIISNIE